MNNSDYFLSTDAQLKKFGFSIPGYHLIRQVATGGMSTILLARPVEDDNEVVLKVMFTDEVDRDSRPLKRFMQEYVLISYLNHPHVIRIYERGFAANFAYIAMEYCPAGDLGKKLEAGINLEVAIKYIRQICAGLAAIHDINVVHCDLKPSNILFRNDVTLTVTDFGAAYNQTGETENPRTEKRIVGTPYYLSPERCKGLPFDHRSDLYNLGVIVFQMLTGKRPYTGRSIPEVISKHINAPIPILAGVLAKYQPLIDGLLAKEADERFQSANDVILGLDYIKSLFR